MKRQRKNYEIGMHKKVTSSSRLLCVLACVAVFLITLYPHPARALCQESTGGGAVFYKFDRIVLFFWDFPHPDVESLSTYPAALKFDTFSADVKEEVKKNFAPCLEDVSLLGKRRSKPILITRKFIPEVYAPDSLTIILKLKYSPPTSKELRDESNFGILQYSLFRSRLSAKDAIGPLMYYNDAIAIFPFSKTIDLQKRLNSFYKMLKPEDFSTEYLKAHPEYRGPK